ncbi:MAG: DNA polymerase III subunit gamma/tau [Candidatus Jorgensenbacteria bacterium]
MTLAIYRRYRPATFGDLLGQELTARTLKEAAKQEKLAHAYLLAGPRGTGKTTTARLIAKIANCETRAKDAKFRGEGEPCNHCTHCTEIDEGRSLDVIEIDGASNRGIDEIRDLKDSIRLAPTSSPRKVFIIDEAHQLTPAAFNALLKSLEEPPPHIVIILATTEADRIPPTIVSRTQQFHFRLVPRELVVNKLHRIVKEEGVGATDEALELIAASGEGSFRDAESLLDQLIAFGDKDITLADVEGMIGKVGFTKLSRFAGLLLANNRKDALAALAELTDGGYNLAQFTKDLIQYLRRVAVVATSPAMANVFAKELTKEHLEQLAAHAKEFKDAHLELLKALIGAYGQMRYSQFPIIPLEVAIIEALK